MRLTLACFAVVLVAALVSSPTHAAEPAGRIKALVLDVNSSNLSPSEVDTLTSLVTAHLARYPQLDVLSGADLKRLVDLEAQKQSAGCDEGSCLSEIAGAIGAQLVFFGQAGKLGSTIVVTLNVFDAGKGQAVGRQVIEARDLGQLPALVGPAVDQMVRPLFERMRGGVGDAAPGGLSTIRADPSLNLGTRAREVFAQQEMNVCVDEQDRLKWWFCDKANRYTENEFIRKYKKTTGKADLDTFEDNRNPESVGVPAGLMVAGAGLLGVAGTVGYLTYLDTGSGSQFLKGAAGSDGTSIGAFITGGALVVGAGLLIYGGILLPDALAFTDGRPTDHSMTEPKARDGAARFNDALAEDIGKEYGTGP